MKQLTQTDRPYDVAPQTDDPLALSLNENPFAPLPAVHTAIVQATAAANRYPEVLPERLRRLIATHVGVEDEQVIVAAGATGVVMQVLHTVTSPGDRIVLATPTFDGYPIFAQMARLTPVGVPLDRHGHQDLESMADAADDARVVVICRPHNPTGTVAPTTQMRQFLNRVPSDVVVVIDEAYIEFVHPAYRLDCRKLVRRYPNVIVVRTFSKAYGLAGMRTGYGICSPRSAAALWAMQLPFGSTFTSLAAVAASYAAEEQLQKRIRFITAERTYLRTRLGELRVASTESHANFVYLPPSGKPWREAFEGTGLQVRSYSDGGVRISVGARRSTTAVLAAIGKSVGADR